MVVVVVDVVDRVVEDVVVVVAGRVVDGVVRKVVLVVVLQAGFGFRTQMFSSQVSTVHTLPSRGQSKCVTQQLGRGV